MELEEKKEKENKGKKLDEKPEEKLEEHKIKKFEPEMVEGLSLFDAIKFIQDKYSHMEYSIYYSREYPERLEVFEAEVDKDTGIIFLTSGCLDDFTGTLPEIYQEDDAFLQQFLQVFQHIINGRTMLLDDIHQYFSPMKCPKYFLPVLAAWFNIDLSLLGNKEEIVRKVIQFAVPLFKLKGTQRGLRLLLYIITGVMPQIVEGAAPFTEMTISNKVQVDSPIFGNARERFSFYVYFPVLETYFESAMVANIHSIVQKEKPAYMKAYVCFKKPKRLERKITTFDTGMEVMGEEGVYF